MTEEVEWHYRLGSLQVGPVSTSKLLKLLGSGKVDADTPIWREGMGAWRPFAQTELATMFPDALGQSPPTPPPLAEPKTTPPTPPPPLVKRTENRENQEASVNPYAAPHSSKEPVAPGYVGRDYHWKSPKAIGRIAIGALATTSLMEIVLAFSEGFVDFNSATLGPMFFVYFLSALIVLLSAVLAVIFFCMWTHRCASNTRAFGADPNRLQFTPGWSVGWFFIPIMFLWKPLQAHREIWEATREPERPERGEVPTLVNAWWAFWIIGNLAGNVSFRAPDSLAATWVSAIFACISGGLAILVILGLSREQDEQAEAYGLM